MENDKNKILKACDNQIIWDNKNIQQLLYQESSKMANVWP